MKKLLALLGTITLGTSTFMADTSTITTAKTVIENNIFDEEGLNWNEIKSFTNDYLNNLKDQPELTGFNSLNKDNSKEIMNIAYQKANEILNFLESNNFSYEESINYLLETSPELKEAYNQKLNDSLINLQDNFTVKEFELTSFAAKKISYQEIKKSYDPTLRALHGTKIFLLSVSIAASAAAVVFYAAAFWTWGATLPFAAATSYIAIIIDTLIYGIDVALDMININLINYKKLGNVAIDQITLGVDLADLIFPLIFESIDNLSPFGWAFEGVKSVLSVLSSTKSLIDEIKYFN